MRDYPDLDTYFARIGFAGSAKPDLETLRALHRLHPLAIPFENLSTLLREPIPTSDGNSGGAPVRSALWHAAQ